MITGFKNKHLLSIVAVFLLVVLVAVPVMGAERATKENMCEPFDFDESNPKEIPGIDLRDSFIEVPTEWELGYNPAEESSPDQAVPGKVRVLVNGNLMQFPDQEPYIDKASRTMVPVRFVTEALGAKVDFKDNTVIIDKDGTHIEMRIGENKATVNGGVKTFDTKSVLTDKQRTMVPLRFLSETLGAKVGWNQATWTATVELS